jgi:hypothetical protein
MRAMRAIRGAPAGASGLFTRFPPRRPWRGHPFGSAPWSAFYMPGRFAAFVGLPKGISAVWRFAHPCGAAIRCKQGLSTRGAPTV